MSPQSCLSTECYPSSRWLYRIRHGWQRARWVKYFEQFFSRRTLRMGSSQPLDCRHRCWSTHPKPHPLLTKSLRLWQGWGTKSSWNFSKWKRGSSSLSEKRKGDHQNGNTYGAVTILSVRGKIPAHLLLKRRRSHVLKLQRPKQLGLTPGKSTNEYILAHCVLVEHHHKFW